MVLLVLRGFVVVVLWYGGRCVFGGEGESVI